MIGRYKHLGAAMVPIGQVDRANEFMIAQGFGPCFNVEVGPAGSSGVSAVANFQPINPAIAAALRMCVEYMQGDWVPITEETNPGIARASLDRELLKSRLEIKGLIDAARYKQTA